MRVTGRSAEADRTNRCIEKIAGSCVGVRLRMMNWVVTNLYDKALRQQGVKTNQLNIRSVTARPRAARPSQVCELLQIEPSTLSRNVDRLRASGWLEKAPGKDARSQPFRLTPKGMQLIEKVSPAWEKA